MCLQCRYPRSKASGFWDGDLPDEGVEGAKGADFRGTSEGERDQATRRLV
jgi:hypothetical protein